MGSRGRPETALEDNAVEPDDNAVELDDGRAGVGADWPSQVLVKPDGWVAFDTESSGLFVDDGVRCSTISVAYTAGGELQAWAFPFDQGAAGRHQPQASLFDDQELAINLPRTEWEYLLDWLSGQGLVAHNAKHDLHIAAAGTRDWPGVDLEHALRHDTMVAHREIEPTLALGLDDIAKRLRLLDDGGGKVGDTQLKGWLRKNGHAPGRYDLVPWDIMGQYAHRDAVLCYLLCLWQHERMNEGIGSPWTVAHRTEVLRVLYRMERRGIAYDAAASLDEADRVAAEIRELEAQLPFRNTVEAAKRYFFDELGHPPYKVTAKGNPQLDDETVRRLVDDGVQWAAEYADLVRRSTALSMWYRGYPEKVGPDGRLRTSFKQTKVRSGRMSVERMNLQAIPKDDKTIDGFRSVRSFFRARDGYRLWNLDLSQAELRVAAKYARCKRMLEMLADGADLHSITTEEVLGVKPGAPDFKVHRDIGKRLTFSGIFQIGPATFQATLSKQAGIDLPLDECESIVHGWRAMYPEYGRAYRHFENVAINNGCVIVLPDTPWATRSWFGPRDWPNTAWSRRVQGSLAEFLGLWLVQAERILQSSGDPEVRDALVLTVHDSLVLELPDDERGPAMVERIASAGARFATRLFGIEMGVDSGLWHKD